MQVKGVHSNGDFGAVTDYLYDWFVPTTAKQADDASLAAVEAQMQRDQVMKLVGYAGILVALAGAYYLFSRAKR